MWVVDCVVQRMKTLWGSCTPAAGRIRLNLELAKKPQACLEYIVVHELVHLIEPTHNAQFRALMDHHMPDWSHRRDELNRLPVRHETWGYQSQASGALATGLLYLAKCCSIGILRAKAQSLPAAAAIAHDDIRECVYRFHMGIQDDRISAFCSTVSNSRLSQPETVF